jgi:hypothetical protein
MRTPKHSYEEVSKYLIDKVKKNPSNLTQCFKETAEHFDYHPTTIERMWYGYSPYQKNPIRNQTYCFSVVGHKSSVNRKNIHNNCNESLWTTKTFKVNTIFSSIKKFFKKLF